MVVIQQSAHDRMVREVADRYIRQGYYVQIEPADNEMPAFLRGYKPDLIITTPEGHIVAEVKTKGKVRREDYWEGLKNAVDANPGWRLQFIINNRREEELLSIEQPILSHAEIEARLLAGQKLADSGLFDSALLVVWAALEAVLREVSRTDGVDLPNQGPAPLITILYTEGQLRRKDYDSLMQLLQIRNQAAHGFHVDNIDRSLIDDAEQLVRRLKK